MKILIILASGIGNSIFFSPTLKSIKEHFKEAEIHLFAYKNPYVEPYRESELIDKIYNYEGPKTILRLIKEGYDVSICAFPSNKWHFNVFSFIVGAKKRITHSYKFGKLRTLSFLQNYKIDANENLHDVEQNLNLLKALDIKIPKRKELIFFTDTRNEKNAKEFIKKNNLSKKHLIGVHPGSGPLGYKRAPLEKFVEEIDKNSKKNSVVIIFGGLEEEEIKKELRKRLSRESYVFFSNLKDTATLIRKCDIFITNDTGLMHIASTSKKTKIIALFYGTNPSRTRPYTNNSEIIMLRPNKLKYPFWSTNTRQG